VVPRLDELIQQNRASVDRTLPERTSSVDGPENSEGASMLGPKRRIASGRYVA
jgi:hypothetical protein